MFDQLVRVKPQEKPKQPRPKREPRPQPAAVANPWNLTPMQFRVLLLQCELGTTQADVAARLGLSVKTTNTHMTRLRAKMGARGVVHACLLLDRWLRSGG